MNGHAGVERLLATEIDFPLSAAEQAQLADHLADCSTCSRLGTAYRSDAATLQSIAEAQPPARIFAAISLAAARPSGRVIEPWKLLVAAILLLVALFGAANVIGSLSRVPPLLVVGPIPTPGTRQTPASPRPVVVPASVSPALMAVDCGPLVADSIRCFELIAATANGLSTDGLSNDGLRSPILEVHVEAGTTYPWCAPPDPCVSPPPDSFWVDFRWRTGNERIPVYGDTGGGWLLGVPAVTEAPSGLGAASPSP